MMKSTKTALAIAMLAAFPLAQAQVATNPTTSPAGAQAAGLGTEGIYAQSLIANVASRHPELIEIDVHAKPAGTMQSVIVAAKSSSRLGRSSDAANIAVFESGQPRVEINQRGDQNAVVGVPLFDIYGKTLGSVEFAFLYPTGSDKEALVHKAERVRDEMSRRIHDLSSLLAPTQRDPNIATQTYAQFLVDEALQIHADVEVMTLRALTPQTGGGYPIIASNIGRIGKPAEGVALTVIQSGKTYTSAEPGGKRFEVMAAVKNPAGTTVGAIAVIFPYSGSSDPEPLQTQGEKIAAELGRRIKSSEQLAGPYPAAAPAKQAEAAEEYNRQELGNKQSLPMTKEVASGAALGQTQEGYSEAIKNQAGVQATNSSGSSNDGFSIRGIKLNLFSNYRLDGGLPVTGVITNPTENKDRVETLKGANALMFGVASPAGIINFVTKRAGARDVMNASFAGNSFGQYGLAADVGRRFGDEKQLGVRLNASATHQENGVHDTSGEGYFASVGVDLRATSKLTLQGDLEYYKRHVPEQAGISLLPVKNGAIPITPVPDPRNLLSGSWNVYTPRTINVQLRADYTFTDDWKLLVQAGQSDSKRHRNTIRIGGYDIVTGAGGVVTVQPLSNHYRNTFARTELLGHFKTWDVSHDLTLGLSSSSRYAVTFDVNNVTLTQRQNIFDPIVLDAPLFTKPNTSNPPQTSTDTGLYGYDTIGITSKFKLLLGVRRVQDKELNGSISSKSYVTSPAYGVLFDMLPTTTLFASAMEGLEAGGTAPANATNANTILEPTKSKQMEIGIRDSYFKGLAISASYFKVTRGNAVTDPADNVFKYLGDLEYKGIETTVSYDVTNSLRVNAALLRLKAVQNSPAQPLIDGRVPENTPGWNGNLGLSYKLAALPGLSLKAGLKKITGRPVNNQDQGYIPGYTLYDAGLTYATQVAGRKASFGLSIDNLANKRYWNSVQTGTYGIGMDRSIKFNAKVEF